MWVKLDVAFFRRPDVAELSQNAKLLLLASICFSGEKLTDGHINRSVFSQLLAQISAKKSAIVELISAGFWVEESDGIFIPMYAEEQQSRAEILAKSEARQAAGRQGGLHSGQVRAAKARVRSEANGEAIASDKSKQTLKQNRSKRRSKIEADEDVDDLDLDASIDPPIPSRAMGGSPNTEAIASVTGFDFPGLWARVTHDLGHRPGWNWYSEMEAVKDLLRQTPAATVDDLARFLTYLRTVWPFAGDPTRIPTFSVGKARWGAWCAQGQPVSATAPERMIPPHDPTPSPKDNGFAAWARLAGAPSGADPGDRADLRRLQPGPPGPDQRA